MTRDCVTIRLPAPLWERVKAEAEADRRTITRVIEFAVERYLDAQEELRAERKK